MATNAPVVPMPRPGTSQAPSFEENRPGELLRFLDRLETAFEAAGITDATEKKKQSGKYADQNTEEQWKSLDSYAAGTWAEFKAEILASYPEVSSVKNGSVDNLLKICEAHRFVSAGDQKKLLSLKRKFVAEGKKLLEPPAIISNWELNNRFLSCLTDHFHDTVLARLAMKPPTVPAVVPAAGAPAEPARRPEDKYLWMDIIKMALAVAEGQSTVYTQSNASEPRDSREHSRPSEPTQVTSIKTEVETMRQEFALMQDRLKAAEKTARQEMKQGLDEVKRLFNQNAVVSGGSNQPYRNPAPRAGTPAPSNPGGANACHYCWTPGHYIQDCPAKRVHIEQGKLKIFEDGKVKMADGSFLPREPQDRCVRDRVDSYWEAKKQTQFFLNDFDNGPGLISPGPGVISLENRLEPEYSIFTNAPRDPRDDLILQMQQQLQIPQLVTSYQKQQAVPVTQYKPYGAPSVVAVPPATQSIGFSPAQLSQLKNMLDGKERASNNSEEQSQYANTRARPGKDGQDF